MVAFPTTGAGQGSETLVESMTLENTNQNQSSANQLEAGTTYRLQVSGTVSEDRGGRTEQSDAFYCFSASPPQSPEPCTESSPFFYERVRLTVNGQVRGLSEIDGRKPYSSNHTYSVNFTPSTTGPLTARAATCGCPTTGNIRIDIYRVSSTTTTPTTPTTTTPTDPGSGEYAEGWDGSDPKLRYPPRPGKAVALSSPVLPAGADQVAVAVENTGNSVVFSEGSRRDLRSAVEALDRLTGCFIHQANQRADLNVRYPVLGAKRLGHDKFYDPDGMELCFLLLDAIASGGDSGAETSASSCSRGYRLRVRRKRGQKRARVTSSRARIPGGVRYDCIANDEGGLLLVATAPRGTLRRQLGRRLDLGIVTPRGAFPAGPQLSFRFFARSSGG